MTPLPALLLQAVNHGLDITIDGDRLTVRGPMAAADLGRELLARKPEVLAYFADPSPTDVGDRAALLPAPAELPHLPVWDSVESARLQIAVDDAVERYGCRGSHPDIAGPAARAAEAHWREDMAGGRAACADVIAAAERLAPALATAPAA